MINTCMAVAALLCLSAIACIGCSQNADPSPRRIATQDLPDDDMHEEDIVASVKYFPARTDFNVEILTIRTSGHISWSADSLRGGAPYLETVVDSSDINAVLQEIDAAMPMGREEQAYAFPSSGFVAIEVILPSGRRINLRSAHELFEMDDRVVATAVGIESLNDRTRDDVMKEQPRWFRDFRMDWDYVRARLATLLQE